MPTYCWNGRYLDDDDDFKMNALARRDELNWRGYSSVMVMAWSWCMHRWVYDCRYVQCVLYGAVGCPDNIASCNLDLTINLLTFNAWKRPLYVVCILSIRNVVPVHFSSGPWGNQISVYFPMPLPLPHSIEEALISLIHSYTVRIGSSYFFFPLAYLHRQTCHFFLFFSARTPSWSSAFIATFETLKITFQSLFSVSAL